MSRLLKALFMLYFFLAGVTWVQDADNVGKSIMGRITFADVLMALLVPLTFAATGRIRVPNLAWVAGLVLLAFVPGMLLEDPSLGKLLELAVHVYLVVGFVVMCSYFQALSFEDRLEMMLWWVRLGALLAAIGLWDFFAGMIGLPQFSKTIALYTARGADTGAVTGTFRNTGQAGTFFCVVLACALPLHYVTTRARKTEVLLLAIVTLLALLLTVKRAAIIAVAIGVVLLAFRDGCRGVVKVVAILVVAGIIATPVVAWLFHHSEAFQWRFNKKVTSLAESDEPTGGFLDEIVTQSVNGFLGNPLFGTGLGGTRLHGKYEVHSTYFKVLAESGMIGVFLYAIFLVTLWRSCLRPQNHHHRARQLARAFAPLLIGLMLSWGYTYHLRKREFWVAAALYSSLMAPSAISLYMPRVRYLRWDVTDDQSVLDEWEFAGQSECSAATNIGPRVSPIREP